MGWILFAVMNKHVSHRQCFVIFPMFWTMEVCSTAEHAVSLCGYTAIDYKPDIVGLTIVVVGFDLFMGFADNRKIHPVVQLTYFSRMMKESNLGESQGEATRRQEKERKD